MKKTVKGLALVMAMLFACLAFTACGGNSEPDHKLKNANGVVLIEDDSINVNNSDAQAKLEKYMDDNNIADYASSMSTDSYTANIYAKGNALVYEMTMTIEVTDVMKEALSSTADSFKDSMNSAVTQARTETGIDDLVIVAAYVDENGEVLTSVVCMGE